MLTKIESFIVSTKDYDNAIEFFQHYLGLEMPSKGVNMARFELDNFPIYVARADQGSATFISIESDNIVEDYQLLQKRGIEFQEPIKAMKGGDKAAFFRGPAETLFMLYQPSSAASDDAADNI